MFFIIILFGTVFIFSAIYNFKLVCWLYLDAIFYELLDLPSFEYCYNSLPLCNRHFPYMNTLLTSRQTFQCLTTILVFVFKSAAKPSDQRLLLFFISFQVCVNSGKEMLPSIDSFLLSLNLDVKNGYSPDKFTFLRLISLL